MNGFERELKTKLYQPTFRLVTRHVGGCTKTVDEYCGLGQNIFRRPQENFLNLPCIQHQNIGWHPAELFKAPDQSIIGVLSILTIRAPEVELSEEARPSTSG